jgi:hypothetical protein
VLMIGRDLVVADDTRSFLRLHETVTRLPPAGATLPVLSQLRKRAPSARVRRSSPASADKGAWRSEVSAPTPTSR